MHWIRGACNFMPSMSRSDLRPLQENFCGKNLKTSLKYSQSYDVVCQMALLGSYM